MFRTPSPSRVEPTGAQSIATSRRSSSSSASSAFEEAIIASSATENTCLPDQQVTHKLKYIHTCHNLGIFGNVMTHIGGHYRGMKTQKVLANAVAIATAAGAARRSANQAVGLLQRVWSMRGHGRKGLSAALTHEGLVALTAAMSPDAVPFLRTAGIMDDIDAVLAERAPEVIDVEALQRENERLRHEAAEAREALAMATKPPAKPRAKAVATAPVPKLKRHALEEDGVKDRKKSKSVRSTAKERREVKADVRAQPEHLAAEETGPVRNVRNYVSTLRAGNDDQEEVDHNEDEDEDEEMLREGDEDEGKESDGDKENEEEK